MHEVVKKLQTLISANDWTDTFEQAVASAAKYNIEILKGVKNLQDYLQWMDALLCWVPVENRAGKEIYTRLAAFYFVLDQEPVKALQNKILPEDPEQDLSELSNWMVDYANAWGEYLDTTASINDESFITFLKSPNFHLDEYMSPPSGYLTFNQLFARHFKPGMRPVAAMSDPTVITSAADSTFVGWWQIDETASITVKGLHWTIDELLDGSPYADRFKGGIFMHSFLNTTDYHRLHVPLPGRVLESRYIPGQVYLDVKAVPIAIDKEQSLQTHNLELVRALDALDGTGYQFAQARGLLVMETPVGLVAVMPIGMAQVSSVVMTAEVGKTLFKGEEFAYFQFGGSDHIVLFESACCASLTARPNQHYNMGEAIGIAYPNL